MPTKVMVVDDDAEFVDMLDLILAPEGYEVIACERPEQALEMARQHRPESAIVDLLMPGQDGHQIIEQLRRDPSTAGIHIIVCSAAVRELALYGGELRRRSCDVLAKPFEIDDLLALLKKAARQSKAS